MKELLLKLVDWVFDYHALTLPGWAWLALPIVGVAAVWLLFGFFLEWLIGSLWR